jgi:AAA+ superfamily predicted ATPase
MILEKITNYQRAAYTSVFILTHEENRLCLELTKLSDINPEISVLEWDVKRGLVQRSGNEKLPIPAGGPVGSASPLAAPGKAIDFITESCFIADTPFKNCIYILKDFHLHFDNALIIRQLRNSWNCLKSVGSMIVFVGHKFAIPGELQKEIQLLDYDLPDAESIKERLLYCWRSANMDREATNRPLIPEIAPDILDAAVEAARGMTAFELENAIAYSGCTAKAYNNKFVEVLFSEKIAQLKKSGKLTYMAPDISFDNVGGMQGLKKWLRSRKKAYSKEAKDYNLPMPKGMLLASVPGTGKSLICKAIAKEFDCPLFALDIGSIFESLVGNSERNMREVIKTIESIGKCVILIDEIEKSLSNSAVSGSNDSGVSSRIFATFLTWLNDRNNPAFIVATTNNHTLLPSALIRKGRFDQLFWLDLPSKQERAEIFEVVAKKYKRDPQDFNIKAIVAGTQGYTGAEIEEVFKDAMYKAFDAGREVDDSTVMDVLAEFIPFSHSHRHDLEKMREEAKGKLVMVSDEGDPVIDASRNMRKINMSIGLEE